MIIYNVTVSVEESIKEDWLNWMKSQHIPDLLSLGIFTKAKIHRIITNGDSENTFAVAYTCADMKKLHYYQLKYAPKFQKDHAVKFKDKAIAFRTIMELVKEF